VILVYHQQGGKMDFLKKYTNFLLIAIMGLLFCAINVSPFGPERDIEKEKQDATIRDMVTIAIAIEDYITDQGEAPYSRGILKGNEPIYESLETFYAKDFPVYDGWANPFYVTSGNSMKEAYIIISFGRDGIAGPSLPHIKKFYDCNSPSDFNRDIVMVNGSWIHAPKQCEKMREIKELDRIQMLNTLVRILEIASYDVSRAYHWSNLGERSGTKAYIGFAIESLIPAFYIADDDLKKEIEYLRSRLDQAKKLAGYGSKLKARDEIAKITYRFANLLKRLKKGN
jgi:hypothetical protein